MSNDNEKRIACHVRSKSFSSAIADENTRNKKFSITFISNEKTKTLDYIKDLEKNIRINKQIIKDLLLTSSKNASKKKSIELLEDQLRTIMVDRDNYLSKSILLEKTIDNYKEKIDDMNNQLKEKAKTCLNRLNNKEKEINYYKEKLMTISDLLNKHTKIDAKIRDMISQLAQDRYKEVSNIIEDDFNTSTAKIQFDDHIDQSEYKESETKKTDQFHCQDKIKGSTIGKDTTPDVRKAMSDSVDLKEIIVQLTEENKNLNATLDDALAKNKNLSNLILKEMSICPIRKNNTKQLAESKRADMPYSAKQAECERPNIAKNKSFEKSVYKRRTAFG